MSPHVVSQVSGEVGSIFTIWTLVHPVGGSKSPPTCRSSVLACPWGITVQIHLLGMSYLFMENNFLSLLYTHLIVLRLIKYTAIVAVLLIHELVPSLTSPF